MSRKGSRTNQGFYNIHKPAKESFDSKLFKWTLKEFIENSHCRNITGSELVREIIHKLEDYSGQTWAEVKQVAGGKSSGTNSHFIPFDKMKPEYKAEYIRLDYARRYENVFSLWLTGKKRLVGYVYHGTMHILWYDPEHEIFESHKKHT